jgi:multidrug resistance efflux pump
MKAILWGAAEPAVAAGLLTAQAATLTKGVLHVMWITKIKMTAATVMSVALIGSGGMLTYRTVAAGQGNGPAAKAQTSEGTGQRKSSQARPKDEFDVLKTHNAELTERIQALEAQLERAREDRVEINKFLGSISNASPPGANDPPAVRTPPPQANPNVPRATLEAAQSEVELLKAKLLEKRVAVKAAQAALDFQKKQCGRIEALAKTGSVSAEVVDETKWKLDTAIADLEASDASLKVAQVQLAQAERRVARLDNPQRTSAPAPSNMVQQLRQIESQLDSLRQQTQQLRIQLELRGEVGPLKEQIEQREVRLPARR